MKKTYATITICLLAACLTFAADTPTQSKLPKFEALIGNLIPRDRASVARG